MNFHTGALLHVKGPPQLVWTSSGHFGLLSPESAKTQPRSKVPAANCGGGVGQRGRGGGWRGLGVLAEKIKRWGSEGSVGWWGLWGGALLQCRSAVYHAPTDKIPHAS